MPGGADGDVWSAMGDPVVMNDSQRIVIEARK